MELAGLFSPRVNPETSLLVTDFTSCIMQKIFIYHEKIVPRVQNFDTGGELALAELGYKFYRCQLSRRYCLPLATLYAAQHSLFSNTKSPVRDQNNAIFAAEWTAEGRHTACCLLFICHYTLTFASDGGHKCLHLGDVIAGKLSDVKRLLIKALLKTAKLERSSCYGCKC